MLIRSPVVFAAVVFTSSLAHGFNTFRDSCTGFHNLAWPAGKVTFYLSESGTPDLGFGTWEQAVLDSFRNWEELEQSEIEFQYAGTVAQHPGILDQASGIGSSENRYGVWSKARNIVAFQKENWPEALHGARGVTFALFHNCDGHILQTDIVMNDTYTDWYTEIMPEGCEHCFDVENMVTHEVGHLLGIGHTDVAGATMNICDQPGAETEDCACNRTGQVCGRSLEQDDRAAARSLYAEPFGTALVGRSIVGKVCASPFECASEVCVVKDEDGQGYCSDACESDVGCPKGWLCVEPPSEDNPDGLKKCWFGHGQVGERCLDGCASGLCIGELCTEKCEISFDQCPAGFECREGDSGLSLCWPKQQPAQTDTTEDDELDAVGGCQLLGPNLGPVMWLLCLGLIERWRRHRSFY